MNNNYKIRWEEDTKGNLKSYREYTSSFGMIFLFPTDAFDDEIIIEIENPKTSSSVPEKAEE